MIFEFNMPENTSSKRLSVNYIINLNYQFGKMLQRMAKGKANTKAVPKGNAVDEETLNELRQAFKIFDSKNTGKGYEIQDKSTQEN